MIPIDYFIKTTVTTAALALATGGAFAKQASEQSGTQSSGQSQAEVTQIESLNFTDADTNGDGRIEQGEFDEMMSSKLPNLQASLGDYDKNADQALDIDEFNSFKQAAVQKLQTEGQSAQAGSQQATTATSGTAASTQGAQGTQGSQGAQVNVKEHPAQVNVKQQPAKVVVEQPKPNVEVTQPKPEVNVQQAKPNVTVSEAKPQVHVQKAGEPKVRTTTSTSGTAGTEQGALMEKKIGDVKGKEIVNANDQKLGKVDKVVKEEDTGRLGVTLGTGGFIGLDQTEVFIPLADLQAQGNHLRWQTQISKDQLKQQAEHIDKKHYVELTGNKTIDQAAQQTTPTSGQANPNQQNPNQQNPNQQNPNQQNPNQTR